MKKSPHEIVRRTRGRDTIRVSYFTGVSTVEKIDGGLGINVVAGTQYNDTLDLSGTELFNIANLDGGIGNDVITGSAGNDTIIGGAGSDVLAGGAGDDTFLIAGTDTAYDRFQGDAGFDTVLGSDNDDTIRVNYFTGASTVEKIDGGLGINTVAGTQYNDTIDFSSTELVNIANIDGRAGNDVINGSAGNDIIIGAAGSDVLAGGLGEDTFLINGTDTAYDRFQGDAGFDTIQGGDGDDTIRVNYFTGASTVERIDGGLGINVIAGTQYNDTMYLSGTELVNISNIDGGIGNDVITGSAGNDTIIGGAGSDVLAGGAGDDTFLISGTDTAYDRFQGDAGFDTIQGGEGDDTIRVNYFTGASTAERIDGGLGTNVIAGTQYNDTLDLSATELVNIANIDGGMGNDVITGSAGNDILFGGDGSDVLRDNGGNNLLDGGSGNDMLTGNAGNEFFVGGIGNDTITAGNGADIIAFNRGDGQDSVNGGIGTDNTIALGGGTQYSDLALSKSGNDLILEAGNGDQINLKSWYATTDNYKSVLNLQVVADAMAGFDRASNDPMLNKSIQDFDFTAIVDAFDQAGGGSANFAHWSATNSLLAAHLSASDSEALGGDLAYQYGKNGSFAGVSQTVAQEAINAAQFGSQAQVLRQFAGL